MRRRDPVGDFERATRADLHERRWLRWHALLLGGTTLVLCLAVSGSLRRLGVDSVLWRPLLALALTYPLYLALLWLWGRWLVSREEADDALDAGDAIDAGMELADGVARMLPRRASPLSGGGGDYAGGGATGRFDLASEAGGALSDASGAVADAVGSAAGAAGDSDEAGAVVVPLVVVIGVAVALAAALGFAVFGLFGVEVLTGVAVEVAFASFGGALAWRGRREGWLAHALRRTAWPMAGLLASMAVAGLLVQTWLPEARTWPQALRLLFG